MVGNHEVVGYQSVQTENSQMASVGASFGPTYVAHKTAKSMSNFISQSCGDL